MKICKKRLIVVLFFVFFLVAFLGATVLQRFFSPGIHIFCKFGHIETQVPVAIQDCATQEITESLLSINVDIRNRALFDTKLVDVAVDGTMELEDYDLDGLTWDLAASCGQDVWNVASIGFMENAENGEVEWTTDTIIELWIDVENRKFDRINIIQNGELTAVGIFDYEDLQNQ